MKSNDWTLIGNDTFQSKYRRFEKKYPQETAAAFNNLDTYFNALSRTGTPTFKAGFIHPEGNGIAAIDQSGHGRMKQVRLYVYPNADSKELHLITIGDKTSQDDDIQYCRKYVRGLRNRD